METCHISNLPDELLVRIVQYIPDKGTCSSQTPYLPPVADYRSVALVCRRLNRVANAVLYAQYIHDFDHRSSAPFIRTLFEQPNVAQIVRGVEEITIRDRKRRSIHRPAASLNSLVSVIHHLDMINKDDILSIFRQRKDPLYDLEAALIIALTPNIQALALNFESEFRFPPDGLRDPGDMSLPSPALQLVLFAARGVPCGQVHRFEHLRKLKLNMSNISVNSISSVLRLKSLVDLTLTLTNYKIPWSDNIPWGCPPKESSVKTIRLEAFSVDVPSIVNLIASCRSLEGFALCASRTRLERTNPFPNYALLLRELQQRHPELQNLFIDDGRRMDDGSDEDSSMDESDEDSHMDQTDRAARARLGSLEKFRDLKYLHAPLELLIGLDNGYTTPLSSLLPSKLETLILTKGEMTNSQNKEFGRKFCDYHVQSVLTALQTQALPLKAVGILYKTDFRYPDAYTGYAITPKDLARMEDVHFNFYEFTRAFQQCGIHFDYEIRVDHELAYDRLISVRRIHGDAVADEYSGHLTSTCRRLPHYKIQGFEVPRFLDSEANWYEHF
ncbi:hypothetical protein BU23DRAFT_275977 [Bimuria novae-zelandiae CBS 107.79]|uniref:F-box domain-containing protein n=1 Tax=Bimuria novae-zelandiae CBS 107.79 TaxID=1447943 RepID=A0A6A5VL13_9PLEO|nr:hypothetical protein BU23DRAFT_275977 [Bimuria novae-zelandiae CBS 107.79]